MVDIYPYRFVQFVDMGMFSERYYANKGGQNYEQNTSVYFLVSKFNRTAKEDNENELEEKTSLRIMCYKQFPFELKKFRSGKYPEGFFKDPCLHILSGEISFD